MVEWTRDDIRKLIAVYRKNPAVWNKKQKSYKDRTAKEIGYKNIQEEMLHMNGDLTLDQIKKKIHTIRTQYKREIKSVRESKSGIVSGDDHVYVPRLWCFDLLDFLQDEDFLRESTSPLDIKPEVSTTVMFHSSRENVH